MDLAVIGTGLGILVNVVVIGLAIWQGRVSVRSAEQANKSANIALESLALQKEAFEAEKREWSDSRSAKLSIVQSRMIKVDGGTGVGLWIRNEGHFPAIAPTLWFYLENALGGMSTDSMEVLRPTETRRLVAKWGTEGGAKKNVEETLWIKLVVTYRDGNGSHKYTAIYRFHTKTGWNGHEQMLTNLFQDDVALPSWLDDHNAQVEPSIREFFERESMQPPRSLFETDL